MVGGAEQDSWNPKFPKVSHAYKPGIYLSENCPISQALVHLTTINWQQKYVFEVELLIGIIVINGFSITI